MVISGLPKSKLRNSKFVKVMFKGCLFRHPFFVYFSRIGNSINEIVYGNMIFVILFGISLNKNSFVS
jgi:hypothetical protein